MLVLGSTYIYCVHNNWIGNQITYTLNEIYWIEYVTDRAQTCVEKKIENIIKFTFEIRILYLVI